MYVLGTAGHVDHGKSALVTALTGIDPDRLPEEKERQMTIDLGFAWFTLPDGREVSIVDVPGHEDFIRNMLAGVSGIDVALLIIAADKGVMPQTREHLAILDLLRVDRGIIVITKKELVDKDVLELATLEAEEVIKGTSLSSAPTVAVSAFTGEGIPELKTAIARLLDSAPPQRDIGRPRLPIDRIFTIKGFGTVVTGTLIDGRLQVGQEVEILPPGLKANIRRLETHKQKLDVALPGSRVSVNLAGIPPEKLARGMVITTPGWLKPSELLDVRLRAVADLPRDMTHNKSCMFYSGTGEVPVRVRLLDKERLSAGEVCWAQLRIKRPVAVAKGDLFIIRYQQDTLGGGEIVDTTPKRHSRFQESVTENLKAREKGTPEEILLAILDDSGPTEFEKLLPASYLGEAEAKKALDMLVAKKQVTAVSPEGPHRLFFSRSRWEKLSREVSTLLQSYHAQYPLRRGMPRGEMKSRLRTPPAHFDNLLGKLAGGKALLEEGTTVRLSDHAIRLTPEQETEAAAFIAAVSRSPFPPPAGWHFDSEVVNMLVQDGRVTRVGEGYLTASTHEEVARRVAGEIRRRGKISVAEVRELFGTSRENAIALVQYLDEKNVTIRVAANERVLKQ